MLVRKIIFSILNLFDQQKEKIPNLIKQKFNKYPHLSKNDKNRVRICINEIIRYHPIESIGYELRESMTEMKKII